MIFISVLCFIFSVSALEQDENIDFSDHQVWSVPFNNISQPEVVTRLNEFQSDAKVDVLKITEEAATFIVNPVLHGDVGQFFEDEGLSVTVVADNVHVLLEEMEAEHLHQRKSRATGCGCVAALDLASDYYMTLDEIQEYLFQMHLLYPRVSLTSIGKTIENRDIWMVTIKPDNPDRVVFIEGGIHAREWIAPAVTLHLIDMMVKTPFDLGTVQYNIVPVANPDGYAYTHINSNTRLWRKNRRVNSGSSCRGVDLNRNWDYYFGGRGTSSNPCSNIYKGTSAFSEPETTALKNAMLSTGYPTAMVLCLHSKGQLMLYTYSHSTDAYPPASQYSANVDLAVAFTDAIYSVNQVAFTPMKSTDLYEAAGITMDWGMGVLGAYYSYTPELRDTGFYGWELPADQITDSRNEFWAGFEVLVLAVQALSI